MTYQGIDTIIRNVFSVYQEIELSNRRITQSIQFNCPERCGSCCLSLNVYTTVTECFPLVNHILRANQIEDTIQKIDHDTEQAPCIFFSRYPGCTHEGFCTVYRYRPLVCRMFGFCSRKRKNGTCEPQVCKVMKVKDPEAVARFAVLCEQNRVHDMASRFLRIASIDPMRGFRLMPINDAIKETIDFFYWRKPRFFHPRKSA